MQHHKTNIEAKLKKILDEIDAQIKEDSQIENRQIFDDQKKDRDLLNQNIDEINQKTKASNKLTPKQKEKIQKQLETIKKNLIRLEKYEEQLKIMGKHRNSYPKQILMLPLCGLKKTG